ncbi:hypothetical protein L6452_02450 [Arctium lappa]|uniref:Uncharacterized protein n=1 Tax=Arctium lappa TaxID=4217 RepID=A0ACB9FJK8_ARCLA|nr:hypothetical protein L6452_02450 [Arctium lappa]
MYNHKSNKNPSFSSTLLDEIYRSIDAGDDDKQSGATAVEDDEGTASLRRAFLVEKWMDIKTLTARTRPSSFHRKMYDPFPLTAGSGSSSSESSYGWLSEQDGLCDSRSSHKPSCFAKPKPIKTDAKKKHQKMELDYCSNHDQGSTNGSLIKSKARAFKIYANLTKVKQPISPGGRLMTFLNSLFANGHVKKPKDSNSSGFDNKKIERTTHGSTCSSASSFTRSCLSKNSPRSREKLNNGIRRTVRFYPVSVIIDEHSRPCGKKFIRDEEDFAKYNNDDDEDTSSDSSSDLFELDHLSILQECDEELPVYETTHFGRNRAIANGLIC